MDAPFPEGLVECVRGCLLEGAKMGRYLSVYPHIFESSLMFPLQRMGEMAAMLQLADSFLPHTIMDIGSDKGGGLYHWCKCLEPGRVIACEIRGLPYAKEFERAFPGIEFLWLPQTSLVNTPKLVEKWLDGDNIDLLFIDGDKSKFLEDFDTYRSLVSDEGLVLMHDIQDTPTGLAFSIVARRGYPSAVIIDTVESAEARVRQLRGVPAANPHEGWLRHWGGKSCGVGCLWMKEGLK